MIIPFAVNINNYDEIVLSFYGIWEYTCPCCRAKRSFNRHAQYSRNLCGVHESIFNPNSLEAIYSCCNGSTRKLNTIVEKSLLIGAQPKTRVITTEMVMAAQNESELIS
jgi:hypothetical protein